MIGFFSGITFMLCSGMVGVFKRTWHQYNKQDKTIVIVSWLVFAGTSLKFYWLPFYKILIS